MNEYLNEEGKVITEKEILASAKESGITPEEVISLFNLKLKTEDSGNTLGAAVKTADVAPEVIADTDLTLVNGSSELQETEPKPRRGRAQVRQEELKRRKDATWSENFASNVVSDSFKDLSSDQLLEIKEKAANELVVNNPNVEYSFNDADIEAEALKIFNEEVVPKTSSLENVDWIKQASTELKIGAQRTLGQLARIPKFINEIKTAAARDIILSEEEQKEFDNLPSDVKDMIVGSGDASSLSSQALAKAGEKYFKEAQVKIKTLSKDLATFDKGIGEDIAAGNLGRAAARAISGAIGSAPSILQALTGPIGISSIFAGSAAEASAKAQEEGLPLSLKTVGYSSTIGASEALLELVTRGIGKSVFKGLFKKPKEIVVKQLKEIALGLGKDFGAEGISEVSTEIINKTADNLILGKEDAFKDSFSELVDVFIIGGVAGGGLSSVKGVAELKQNIKAKKGIEKITSTVDAADLKNVATIFDKPLAEPITKELVDIAQDKNTEIGLSFMLNQAVKKNEITQEQAAQSMAKFNQTRKFADQVEKTKLNLTADKKAEVVNLLSEKNDLQKQIKGVDESLASVQKQRINEIDDAIKATTQEASKVKLQEETKVVEKLIGKEQVKSFNTVEEFVKETGSRPDADAFIDKSGNVFINTQRASEVGAFSAASHELLHRVIKSTFSDKVASANLVKNFNEVLEKEGYLDIVQKRIDDNYRYNEDGSERAFEEYAEEYLTSFSDAIATGAIEFNESKFKKFMQPIVDFLRKVGYSKIEFKDGRDVYNFVKDYQKNIQKGELSKRAQALQTKGEQVAEDISKPSVSKINQQIEQLETEYEQGEVDFDAYEQQLSNLEAKLERAKAKPVEEVRKPKAKEDKRDVKQLGDALNKLIPENTTNKEYKEKVVGTVAAELSGRTLNPLIKKIAAGYGVVADNVYGKSWDDFYTAVKGVQFIKNLQKFNPEINDDFGGFVIGSQYGIRNRVKEALGKFKKEGEGGFKEDVSVAKDIAAAEPTAGPVVDKPKYKNLVQQKVLSTEGLKTVRDKVISSVRVLKSKFDAAVTKNVSVPPIIAEIKKDIGKQADIVFKKEMGGIKNNELQNYLKTNKKAILENMTTFYLTKAFPEAIQKSVGGKYLLDKDGKRVINDFGDATFVPNFVNSDIWKGVKIDREKTSTEAKGKTSGNEIIRRVPNVNQAISDELFLSKFIGADGKPIRGRKESLAKAMGEEIAFDIINQDLKTDGPISEALKNNQEALGVVITENFEENMSRQIERGNIKFSISKDINEGVSILLENGMDQSSMAYNDWYGALNSETKDFWDEEFLPMFSKMNNATRRHFVKNEKELFKIFPSLKKGIEDYNKAFLGSSNPKSNPELAAEQLVGFQNGLSEIIGNTLSKIKGFKIYGKSTRIGDLSDKAKNNLTKPPSKESEILKKAREAAEASINKVILYKSGKEVNRINNFITNSIDGSPSDVAAAFEKALGKETREAKEANALIFEYVNLAALEYVINSKDVNKAFSGYLRWLETNNNNSAGLKALAFVGGFEIVKNQAVYLNSKGKKYYSKGGLKVLENFDNGKGLKVNKKHTNWKEAESFLDKEGILKNVTGLQRDKMIASALEIMGEHQQSMGETGIRLSIALAETIESIEKGVSVDVAKENYNLKVKEIYSNFGLIFNSRFIGSIQNKALGLTSTLKKARIFAVDKKISNNFFTIEGNKLTEEGKNELNEVVKNIVKAKETASLNDKVKKVPQTSNKLSLTKEFNSIIERNKGVAADATYSKIVAKRMGANIGKYKFYLPSSAEDFRLLTSYAFSGKGKQGTKDMAWFDKNLIRPYTEAIAAIDVAKQTTKNDFKALNKAMPNIAKTIGDLIPTKDYTNDQAVRVYLWNKAGYTVPGLNEKEVGTLVAYVAGNPELALYAESLLTISKSNEWLKPGEHWDVSTILSDINNLTEKGGRKAYLAQWIENVDEIFSEQNLNKIEALYGKRHREALEDSLYRMKNGTNRPSGSNAQVNRWNNWLNNSIGSIMFFNRRSALLQLLSTSNFLNWSDNNPVKAAKAFANQKQYWKDFSKLFNSDKLKQRRGGLRADVNEAEIANAAANSKNKAVAALSWLLKKGFTPTQIADSFAIASGGATFYRNRINTYLNQKDAEGNNLYTEKQAEDKAFLDFIEVSDQSQQSSDPSLVSMEQASILGRLVLAFQNTTQQYSRIMKRSALDIVKRRQMPGTTSMLQSDFSNFSKIMYYGAIQNLIFNSLSAAIFALIPGFGEEEEEEEINKSKAEKIKRIANGSIDSLLRGMGVRGAVVAQIKNTITEYFKQKEKGFTGDQTYTVIQVANLSPPIGSKLKKIYSAITGYKYSEELMRQRGLDLTAAGRLNLSPSYAVLGSLASGTANIPLDRMYAEIQGVAEMLDERNTIYQRLALSLGFRSWDVNAKNEEDDLIKAQIKEARKIKRKEKAKAKRVETAKQKVIDRRKAYESLTEGQKQYILSLGKNARKKALDRQAKQLKEK